MWQYQLTSITLIHMTCNKSDTSELEARNIRSLTSNNWTNTNLYSGSSTTGLCSRCRHCKLWHDDNADTSASCRQQQYFNSIRKKFTAEIIATPVSGDVHYMHTLNYTDTFRPSRNQHTLVRDLQKQIFYVWFCQTSTHKFHPNIQCTHTSNDTTNNSQKGNKPVIWLLCRSSDWRDI